MASLYLRSNGYYYLLTYVHKRRVWKSTGCKVKAEAMKYISEGRRKLKERSAISLNQFSAQLLTYLESNLAKGTVALYRGAFRSFISLLGNLRLNQITPQHVEKFKLLRSQETSPVKVNVNFRVLLAAFNIAVNWDLIANNPFRKCKQLRIPPQKPLYLTHEEFDKIRLLLILNGIGTSSSSLSRL